MDFKKQCAAGLALALFSLAAAPAHALLGLGKKKQPQSVLTARKLTEAQSALLAKAIAREKETIKTVRERTPLVETYLQVMKPDAQLLQVPESDWYSLGRVDFSKVIGDQTYKDDDPKQKQGIFKHSLGYLSDLTKALKVSFDERGFVSMLLMDSNSFDLQTYDFVFVRREFLGTVRTSVFDVTPKRHGGKAVGRFNGRVWIEEQDGNVVRFNGGFRQSAGSDFATYDHFDSWRTNVQPNLWLPTSIYVEESRRIKNQQFTISHKADIHVWGYVLKVPSRNEDQETMQIDNATDASNDSQDVGPLGAQRAWVKQAEDNVVDRLFQAGLLDAPSDFDKILEQIANNILIENNIAVSGQIRCRIMLTQPLESLAVGNTIILSKGLIDTLSVPSVSGDATVANLASVISFQLAHILLGDRLDTRYAFNDRLLFPDTSSFARIPMHHTDQDNDAAAKKAMDLLAGSEFKDKLGDPGVYLLQLKQRLAALQTLNAPRLGDSLVKNDKDGTFWMQALATKAPKLDMANLSQQAAMPLGAMLRFDPWTDQVVQLHARPEPILNRRDKMPFEVTPVYIKLTYYAAPDATAPAVGAVPAAGAPATTTPATGTPAVGTPATGAPATGVPATGVPATGTPATGTPGTVGAPPASGPQPGTAPPASPRLQGTPTPGPGTPPAANNSTPIFRPQNPGRPRSGSAGIAGGL